MKTHEKQRGLRALTISVLSALLLTWMIGCGSSEPSGDGGRSEERPNQSTQTQTTTPTQAQTTAPTQAQTTTPTQTPGMPVGIRPEFKKTMDSYEAFFDEYCAFMKRYAQGGNAMSMLSDYMSFLSRYTEAMEDLEAMGDEEMSDAELVYYTEVMARITNKLLEIA